MLRYFHLFKSFSQFITFHTVKGFGIVGETEFYIFLEFPSFLYDPVDNRNLISGSSFFFFLNPAWIFGSSWFT